MKVENVLVLGGAGFIGRHLVAELARGVIKVTVPSRRRERAKPLIQLPTVEVLEADVTAPGVLQRLAAGRDAVINLIGILHSRRGRGDECGPRVYTLQELVEFVCAITRRRRLIIPLSDRMSYLLARLMELAPHPLMTRDNYRSMQVPSVCGADCTLPFGLVAQALEAVVPFYLAPLGPRERYPQFRWRARR